MGLRVDTRLIREAYSLYKGFPSFWIIDLPLLLIPNIFYRVAYKVAYRVYRIKIFDKARKKVISKIS